MNFGVCMCISGHLLSISISIDRKFHKREIENCIHLNKMIKVWTFVKPCQNAEITLQENGFKQARHGGWVLLMPDCPVGVRSSPYQQIARTVVSGTFKAYSMVAAFILLYDISQCHLPLQWSHNELGGISNHRCLDCLLNCLFRRGSKKTPKPRLTGLFVGNPQVTGGFPSHRASNAENEWVSYQI